MNVVVTQQEFDNGIRYVAYIKNALEITIDFSCQSYTNVIPSSRVPATFALTGPRKIEIFRFTQKVANQKWIVGGWTKYWCYGVPSRLRTDAKFIYELPFEKGRRFAINQSYQGKHSHNSGSDSEFAVDFGMPKGTTVCAARQGKVIAIRDDSTEGGTDRNRFEHCANVVIVRHNDGTYARYVHLEPHSVLVKLGQTVATGAPLAKSGQSGWATSPHLHFDVFRVVSARKRVGIPIRFQTSEGVRDRLCEGAYYGSDGTP